MHRQKWTGTWRSVGVAALVALVASTVVSSGTHVSPSPGAGPPSLRDFISAASNAVTNNGLSDPLETSGSLVVGAGGSIYVGTIAVSTVGNVPTVTDSAGDHFRLASAFNDSSSIQTYSVFYHDYSAPATVTVSADFPSSGHHYVIVAFAVNDTGAPSLDAVGSWASATSSSSISASVTASDPGDMVVLFPFSDAGGGAPNYYGFTSASPGFANVTGGWASTDSAGWLGNVVYDVEPSNGTFVASASDDAKTGDTAGVAVAIRSSPSTFEVSDLRVTTYNTQSFTETWQQPANVTNDTLWLIPGPCPQPFSAGTSAGIVTSQSYSSLTDFSYCAAVEPWNGSQAGTVASTTVQLADLIGQVVGATNGFGTAPPMAGATVTAYYYGSCTNPIDPTTCTAAGDGVTNSEGTFGLNLSAGVTYYLAASPNTGLTGGNAPEGWGGGGLVRVTPPDTSIRLTVYPYIPYGNATIVLPGYQCEAAYVFGPGCENPVLSWTQSGAFYLTAYEGVTRLSFYSFLNRTAYNLSTFTPLYQLFPSYEMIPSELFATQDGAYVYSWGTLSTSTTALTVEAVNVTTHRWFEYNFTGFTTSAVEDNGQLQLTGWDGNDSQATLILANGSVYDHDLWTGSQSHVATFDYFEANNVYWESYLNGYIDCQAAGSTEDGIEEWQLTGPSSIALERTYSGQWSSNVIVVNGVNGVGFNVTSRQIDVGIEWTELDLAVNGSGTITGIVQEGTSYPAASGDHFVPETAMSSDRPELFPTGPSYGGDYAGFENDSWLQFVDPGHLGYVETNVSPYPWNGATEPFPYNNLYTWQQYGQEGFFYNSSYLLAPTSYQCGGLMNSSCPINGGGGHAVGTVWWMWRLGLPEFPNPAASPAADAESPSPATVTSAVSTASSITIRWNPPASGGVVNYTLTYGATAAMGTDISVLPGVTEYTLTGLADQSRYYFRVEPWNLHYHGTSVGVESATTGVPAPPTGLAVTSFTTTSVSLNWTNPGGGGLLNDTVYWGTANGVWANADSLNPPGESATVAGLDPGTEYYFAVAAWNATGESPDSGVVAQWTAEASGAPSGLTVASFTETSVSLIWSNPPGGGILNDTVYWGTTTVAGGSSQNTSGAANHSTVTGLTSGERYVFAVAAWNSTGESPLSAPVAQRTAEVPSAPTGLTVLPAGSTDVALSWTNPQGGGLVNDTVLWGEEAGAWSNSLGTGGATTDALVTGLTTFSTYYFAVAAWNSTGMSLLSNVVSVVVQHTPPPPTRLHVDALSRTSVTLGWVQASGGDVVNDSLYLFAGGSCAGSYLLLDGGIAVEGAFSGLTPSTGFSAQVTAWNTTGQSPPSECISFSTANPPPGAPTGLQVVGFATSSVSLTWSNPPGGGLLNDTIYWGLAAGAWTSSESLVGPETRANVTSLFPGVLYYFAVTTWNSTGESPFSTAVSQRTAQTPGAPSGVVVAGTTTSSVTLRWTDPPGGGLTNLSILFSTKNGSFDRSLSCGVVSTCTVPGLLPGTTYYFEVVAWNATGSGPTSNVVGAVTANVAPASKGSASVPSLPELTLLGGAASLVACALVHYARGRWRGQANSSRLK